MNNRKRSTCISLVKLQPNAKLPTQQHCGDAGYDICAIKDVTLQSNQVAMIETGLQISEIKSHKNIFLKIEGRSGMAARGVFPVGGVIDETYRGEIKVLLAYISPQPTCCNFDIKAGDRIAQLVVYPIHTSEQLDYEFVSEAVDIANNTRGASGFGSTGS